MMCKLTFFLFHCFYHAKADVHFPNVEIHIIFSRHLHEAVMAERLRRLTRNQIPSGSVGSSPTDREVFFERFVQETVTFREN